MKGIDVARGFGESECHAKDDDGSDFHGIPLAGTALVDRFAGSRADRPKSPVWA
jgi:hypothetical protein